MSHVITPYLTPELDQQIQSELRPGEKLVWAAQPLARLYRWQGLAAMLFGIPFTGFAIFWMTMAGEGASSAPGPFKFFPLFGLPFLAIGVGMLLSPIWMSRKAARTLYAITSQRAIVFEGRVFGGVNVQTFMPDRLTSMTRKQRPDGSGDLIFEQFQQRVGSGTSTIRRGFVAIEQVHEVEELIITTLLAGRVRAG